MFLTELTALFNRDLDQLIANLEKMDEGDLWNPLPGIINSCGVLAQHLTGNLNHFIGHALGGTGYVRDREREFTDTGRPGPELINDIKKLKVTISEVLENLDEKKLEEPYPVKVPHEYNIRQFLIHLYGHLSYHMGQLNYLRRILEKKS